MVQTYVKKMRIDFFAFPVEMRDYMHIALITPDSIIQAIESNSPMIEKRKGELFARLRRKYSPVHVMPAFHPIVTIPTEYAKVSDIPKHSGMIARGFEIVVTSALHGKHSGDELRTIDVIDTDYGRIECKIGASRLYWAGK